jgi:hypothetical protein
MDEPTAQFILNPVVQYGFAGFCVILLGILVWMIKQLLTVLKENNKVIATNTQAIQAVHSITEETRDITIDVKDTLNRKPCIAGAVGG